MVDRERTSSIIRAYKIYVPAVVSTNPRQISCGLLYWATKECISLDATPHKNNQSKCIQAVCTYYRNVQNKGRQSKHIFLFKCLKSVLSLFSRSVCFPFSSNFIGQYLYQVPLFIYRFHSRSPVISQLILTGVCGHKYYSDIAENYIISYND